MFRKLAILLLALAVYLPAQSQNGQTTSPSTTSSSTQTKKSSSRKGSKDTSHTEASSTNNGATAKCKDGTYSFAKHHQGACSHHGGVAEWYK